MAFRMEGEKLVQMMQDAMADDMAYVLKQHREKNRVSQQNRRERMKTQAGKASRYCICCSFPRCHASLHASLHAPLGQHLMLLMLQSSSWHMLFGMYCIQNSMM